MKRAMMGSTERDEILRFVASTLRARIEMVDIDEARVPTSGHAAAMTVRRKTARQIAGGIV